MCWRFIILCVLGCVLILPNIAVGQNNEKGQQLFKQLCASCHGDAGAADGPVGKALPAGTIPDLRKGVYKYAVDDVKMTELIRKGGAGVGLSPMMPPQVALSDEDLKALVAYLKTLVN